MYMIEFIYVLDIGIAHRSFIETTDCILVCRLCTIMNYSLLYITYVSGRLLAQWSRGRGFEPSGCNLYLALVSSHRLKECERIKVACCGNRTHDHPHARRATTAQAGWRVWFKCDLINRVVFIDDTAGNGAGICHFTTVPKFKSRGS